MLCMCILFYPLHGVRICSWQCCVFSASLKASWGRCMVMLPFEMPALPGQAREVPGGPGKAERGQRRVYRGFDTQCSPVLGKKTHPGRQGRGLFKLNLQHCPLCCASFNIQCQSCSAKLWTLVVDVQCSHAWHCTYWASRSVLA